MSRGSSGTVMMMNDGGNGPLSDAATALSPTPGGFPRNDKVDTNRMGPYQVMSYTDGLDNPAYASSIMYYPVDATPPYASTVFSCGFTATKEGYQNFLGPLFASHGIAILLESPTTTGDLPPTRATQLEAGVQQIATENTRDGSPLKGKLATDRVCLIGHSMGGGGTLIAAQDEGSNIRCDSPLQPWEPGLTFPMIVAPTMIIAAQSDTVAAPASNALPFYMSIPSSTPKYYVEVAGANHFLSSGDLGTNYDTQSTYLIAFYKVYLEDDMRYMSILTGMPDPALSQYMHNP
jgi:triacylglycerol lipase